MAGNGLSLANKVSVFRILLVPCIVASLVYYQPERDNLRYLSLALMAVAILSDALDGYIARSKSQQSHLGTILDPIADKLLIVSVLISLSTIRALPDWMRIPAWFNLIVFSRDALLITGIALIFAFTGKIAVKASRLGKWTIAGQMGVILAVLLKFPMKIPLLALVAGLTIASAVGYVRDGTRTLAQS